jgi:VWFA-related protein
VNSDSRTARGKILTVGVCVTVALGLGMRAAVGRQPPVVGAPAPPVATFRSRVDWVRVAAVVRDHKGRLVPDLAARDFEVLENGASRPIADFQHDLTGVSVALLFDVSGSMEAAIVPAREAAMHVLSWLDVARDEAAVYTFDTRLVEVAPFTTGLKALPLSMSSVIPFGETSLHDAIAATAEHVGARGGRARAVVVFTDGNDNASRLKPAQVSAIASAIDVPVYVFAVVLSIDNPSADTSTTAGRSVLEGPLSDLAAWTGGHVFVASTPSERSSAARQILDELRHQYLIAFESSGTPGWHPLEVRARGKDLTVRARSGYIAGQSRPISH